MKKLVLLFLILAESYFFGGCDINSPLNEKLVYSEVDIKKCECIDKKNICYYDTVKSYLLILKDVKGTLKKAYFDSTKVYGILLDNPMSFINGSSDFGKPFYMWKILNGNLSPCNMPNEVINNKSFIGRQIKFSCNVDFVPPPNTGQSYGQMEGHPVQLIKLEILK